MKTKSASYLLGNDGQYFQFNTIELIETGPSTGGSEAFEELSTKETEIRVSQLLASPKELEKQGHNLLH